MSQLFNFADYGYEIIAPGTFNPFHYSANIYNHDRKKKLNKARIERRRNGEISNAMLSEAWRRIKHIPNARRLLADTLGMDLEATTRIMYGDIANMDTRRKFINAANNIYYDYTGVKPD